MIKVQVFAAGLIVSSSLELFSGLDYAAPYVIAFATVSISITLLLQWWGLGR